MNHFTSTIALCFLCVAAFNQRSNAAESPYPKPPNQGGIYVIAHRGAHQGIPENTLAAYRKAIELGADFVELDIRTTKDAQLVSIHNRTIDAYTIDGTRGKISEFTLAELKSLDIGSRVDPKWSDERIPTLDEILKLCKDKIGIYMDIKDAPISAVARRVKNYGMQHQIVWCISPDEAEPLRQACPKCFPMPDPESETTLPQMLKKTSAKIVAPVWGDFSSTFAAKCHAVGAIVFVDEQKPDPAHWQLLLDWGADGIQTDDPEQLINILKRRNE